jgi:N-acetylglucosamine kinase-like BadF-type ATPase
MSLYLCVDCGGSKTSAVICNASGTVSGRAFGGPSNFAYLGLDLFITAVREAVSDALKMCLSPAPASNSVADIALPPTTPTFAAAWFGVSGVDSPAAVASITPALSSLIGIPLGPRLLIANDTHLLAAPLRLHPDISHCVACIAGTGSICVSFGEVDGELRELGRVGGWGWILGDEGGGFHVGREAIRQLLVEKDKMSLGEASPKVTEARPTLKARVLEHFGVTDVSEILTVVHHPDPPMSAASLPETNHSYRAITREKRLSTLCPFVFTSALDDGDPLALNVLGACAELLASQIAILLAPAGNADGPHPPRAVKAQDSVICFGGSLAGVEAYRRMILDNLVLKGHVFKYIEYIEDAAAVGAAGLAASYAA